jgi:hypothetical protein
VRSGFLNGGEDGFLEATTTGNRHSRARSTVAENDESSTCWESILMARHAPRAHQIARSGEARAEIVAVLSAARLPYNYQTAYGVQDIVRLPSVFAFSPNELHRSKRDGETDRGGTRSWF